MFSDLQFVLSGLQFAFLNLGVLFCQWWVVAWQIREILYLNMSLMNQTVANEPMVCARDLHFAFADKPIYQNLNLTIARNKITAIMGPSGCGKSTFLSLLGGRLRPQSGELLIDGEPIPPPNSPRLFALRRQIGMLFQSSALLTDLSVFDNVAFPVREQTNLPEDVVRILVLMKLQLVGLRNARDLMPAELSGGMQRRVALARAIALDPKIVLYDEPFVGLDPISMGVIVKLIRELNDALGLTSVVVTHDVSEGSSIADYVYLLSSGRAIGQGTPSEMQNSDSPQVRQFMNGLPDGPVPSKELFGQKSNTLGD